ncbi:putative competence-damage inducible protein [Candidatus Zixiibacteriota bacterium]|nr:putative competence-damage inducible protein [candidate division Zixibacteria bacterium]
MEIELISIGDEIISGHTLDTNSAFIAARLIENGFWVNYKSAVGDDLRRMEEVIYQALKRADIVITTGGLGPTDDDITKRAIVKIFRRNLIFNEDVLEDLKKRYAARGIKMPAINQNQALLPQGATYLPNKTGSAVGIAIVEDGKIFVSLPGVPHEMEIMVKEELIPFLLARMKPGYVRVIKLRTTGLIESAVAEKITGAVKIPETTHLAYLPWPGGVDLRIVSSGEAPETADLPAETLAKHLRELVGKYIYGENDDTLEGMIGKLLKERGQKLAVAESCTGGLLAGMITSVPGSSAYFDRGVVTYSNRAKVELLGVPEAIIDKHGAVSAETAEAMAAGIRERANTDFGLSITGIAGPDGGTEEKPVGTVFIACAGPLGVKSKKMNYGTGREFIRRRSVYAALELLRRTILGIE